jgi:Flp pilus assembly protein TadG
MDQKASFFGRLAPNRRHAISAAPAPDACAPDASIRSVLPRLFASNEAGAAIEFALVAPALFALILATLQLVLVFLVQAGLETACEGSARYVTTGQAQASFKGTTNAQGVVTATPQQQFNAYVCSQLPMFMGCGYLFADVTSASDYSTVSLAEPTWTYDINGNVSNKFLYSPGTQNQIVVVRLYYFWPVISLLGFNITTTIDTVNNNTMFDVVLATSVAKTESY